MGRLGSNDMVCSWTGIFYFYLCESFPKSNQYSQMVQITFPGLSCQQESGDTVLSISWERLELGMPGVVP